MTKPAGKGDAMAGPASLNAVAGAGAGGVVLCTLFPIDLTKTHMQVLFFCLSSNLA
jgi:hypothetical protein